MYTYSGSKVEPPNWVTKTAFALGTDAIGYVRILNLPESVAEYPIENGLSARVSFFMQAATNAKQAQARLWVANPVFSNKGDPAGYEAWCIGGVQITSDGLSIAAGTDPAYSPTLFNADRTAVGTDPAVRMGGTLKWTPSDIVAAGANPTVPPSILTPSEGVFGEGNSAGINQVGGLGVILLPHLCRKTLLLVDPICLDFAGGAGSAPTAVRVVAEVTRN
jgi:hypothetical protein